MYVIGTAGHVDHGKSTLIETLTGIDPDRLREEKARGMTIELGFAWLKLPSGLDVSIVDVPGHERFIKNMLMGVSGIDLALLIVAADEGVMPQTREHLAILDLLDVKRGIAVLTKSALVDSEWLELVSAEVSETLEGTSLEGSPVLAVSAEEGLGLDALMAEIDSALDGVAGRPDLGRPRLPVDRSFTMSGFGAIVTGTLADGRLRVGQEVEILPRGLRARVRGVQTHRTSIDEALPGTRVAVNLSGIEHHEISRGDVVTIPRWLKSTDAFDATFRVITGAPRPVKHNHRVTLHAGAREIEATVRLLEKDRLLPGESGWAQIRLLDAAPIVKGDLFIIRDTETTLAGGRVLETDARRHRRNHGPTLERLERLAQGSGQDVLLSALEKSEPAGIDALSRAANTSAAEALESMEGLVIEGLAVRLGAEANAIFYSAAGWSALESAATEALREYHAQFPLRTGMPREELRSRLKLKAAVFNHVVTAQEQRDVLVSDASYVRLPGHDPRLSDEQEREAQRYLAMLASDPFSPPTDSPADPEVVQALIDQGKVVRAAEDVVFLKSAYDEVLKRVKEHAQASGEITIADMRDMFGTSRKYTLALLERLDRDQVTRRSGDVRLLR